MTEGNRVQAAELRRQPFRRDIQGLRAVAVVLILLYHAGIPFITGGFVGVDVFFVISGFLITNHLLAQLDQHGRIDLKHFYAARIRRILPASLAVLIGSVALGYAILPRLQHVAMFRDAVATALYVPNMLFAYDKTDYLADPTPSLMQHYWSLGVEEQYYLIVPALLILGFWIAQRSRTRLLWMVIAAVTLSFVFCIYLTVHNEPWAFFSLPTRFWELDVGGILAFVSSRAGAIRPNLAAAGSWLGLAGITAAALLYTEQTPFPGSAAALPVLATAAVIFFGSTSARLGPQRLLGARSMVFIGAISYSLYLVHWPLFMLSTPAGASWLSVPLITRALLALVAVPIAYLLYRLVEQPFRYFGASRRRPKTTVFSALALACAVAIVCTGAMRMVAHESLDAGKIAPTASFSTSPTFTSYVPSNLHPTLAGASADIPLIYSNGCHATVAITIALGCEYGSKDAPISVALFGDSHAAQWFPALKMLADAGKIRLRVDTKSSCPSASIVDPLVNNVPYTQCGQWRANVIHALAGIKPDLIILSNYDGAYTGASGADTSWYTAMSQTIRQLKPDGRILVIANTPHLPFQPATCLSAHLTNTDSCSVKREDAIDTALNTADRKAALAAGEAFLDLNDRICSATTCGPVIGDTLVYRDDSHLTATFSRSLSTQVGAAINSALR